MAWGILANHTGIEPGPTAVEVLGLNPWTAREFRIPFSTPTRKLGAHSQTQVL